MFLKKHDRNSTGWRNHDKLLKIFKKVNKVYKHTKWNRFYQQLNFKSRIVF